MPLFVLIFLSRKESMVGITVIEDSEYVSLILFELPNLTRGRSALAITINDLTTTLH